MATEAQNLSREMAQAYLTGTAPRTNPLSYPACQQFMTLIMQNKPNLLNAQINVTSFITKDYQNKRLCSPRKNKPNSNPIKPNFKPFAADLIRRKLKPSSQIPTTGKLILASQVGILIFSYERQKHTYQKFPPGPRQVPRATAQLFRKNRKVSRKFLKYRPKSIEKSRDRSILNMSILPNSRCYTKSVE